MKIEKIKPTVFQPISIQIKIENQEEFNALKEMVYFNGSIPKLLEEEKHQEIICKFLNKIDDVLIE